MTFLAVWPNNSKKSLPSSPSLASLSFFCRSARSSKLRAKSASLCQGRGSAANSAVCYRARDHRGRSRQRSNLLFERFLSAERNEPPDIDVDFEHERREEVIQAIYEKYGRERAAMVSEVICYRGKSALREAAKAFGFSLEQADRLTQIDRAIRCGRRGRRANVCARSASIRAIERIQLVLQLATQLQGFPRHLSTHVGGFVLSAQPLDEVVPVEPATMPDRTVVPWDKDDIDDLGFFKVDVLGLGMLTAIRKALELDHATAASSGRSDRPLLPTIPPKIRTCTTRSARPTR